MAKRQVVREDVVEISFEVKDDELVKAQKEANEFQKEMSGGMKDVVKDIKKGSENIGKEFAEMQKDMKSTSKQGGTLKKSFDKLKNMKLSKLKTAFTDVKKKIKETQSEANELDGVLGDLGGKLGGIAGALGVTAGVGAIVGSSMGREQAGAKMQGMTGASDKEAKAMMKSMDNLYKNNMGEGYEDLALSMAEVKNQTGATGKELEKTTHNALLLRDTFDFDVKESVRAVDMMTKQFGLSSDEAYNLMVQGAQKGLNKNDNLLDSMNEYGLHFKQIGLGAADMMNIFSNVAEKGVFDIDKIGDAVKEFGIRAIDGSDTTADGFKAIGLDADSMAKKIKAGGESGKQAFQETIDALNSMSDPLKREQAGVALFGTMWEDLGAEAVLAMGSTKNEIKGGTDALNKLNEVRYDSATSALQALGRNVNAALAGPINTALPLLQKGFEFLGKHIKVILPVIALFATLMGLGALATSGMTLAQVAMNGVMVAFKPIMLAAKGAQLLFNAALWANPLTWIVMGVIALIAVIVLLVRNWDTVKAKMLEVWASIKTSAANMKNMIIGAFTSMKDNVKGKVEEIKTSVKEKIDGLLEFLGNLPATMLQKGKDMITGFINGMKDGLGGIGDLAGKIGDKVSEGLEWFKFGSPSKRMKQYGSWAIEGFGGGVEQESKDLRKGVKQNVTNPFNRLTGQTIMQGSSDYVPSQNTSYNKTSNNETNYFSPQFNLTVGSSGDRDTERKVKKWVKEAMNETFESMNRRNPRLTEV